MATLPTYLTRDPEVEHPQDGLADAVLDAATQGTLVFDRGFRVRLCNRAAREILGLAADSPDSRLSLSRLLTACTRLEAATVTTLLQACHDAMAGCCREARLVIRDRSTVPVRFRPLDGGCCLAIIDAEAEMPTIAQHGAGDARRDPLTAIGNRRALDEWLDEALTGKGGAPPSPVALLKIGLDRFKVINDSLGRSMGDAFLCAVARRLESELGDRDRLARLGGDEFAVLLDDAADAEAMAARLIDLLSRAFFQQGQLAQLGTSIGVAVAPRDGLDPAGLLRSVDLALLHAKAEGRGCWRMFRPSMREQAEDRRQLQFDLRKALALRELELHYQPQVSAQTGHLLGFEALARWRSPTRGMVPPSVFVPLAEEIGLITAIGEWALHTACRDAARWPGKLTVAVNVSAHQLDAGARLIKAVKDALGGSGLAPRRLELEITESAMMRSPSDALATLHAARALGVRVSMDDFGTGYSSLSQLGGFPFDKLKIDRSFVLGLAGSTAMMRAIAALGASLGMRTIAEGVETVDQAALIRECGCDCIQGYLVSKPIPIEQVPALIARLASFPAYGLMGTE